MSESVTELAPAKLNLALSVGRPREDGLHPICSWMVTIDLCDELLVTPLPADRLSRYAILWHQDARRRSEIDWSIRDDLAVRAHESLEDHVGRRLPVQLKLEKRIPIGGGLGGGSADAAAMLRALNRVFALDLEPATLASIGARVGADVPFLVHGGSAIVSGIGDEVELHADAPELDVVVVMPDFGCPTGAVYAAYDEVGAGDLRTDDVRALSAAAPAMGDGFNDLSTPAQAVVPRLRTCIDDVRAIAETTVHVSGSGSCLFVRCNDPIHAEHLARAIEERCTTATVAARAVPSGHFAANRISGNSE